MLPLGVQPQLTPKVFVVSASTIKQRIVPALGIVGRGAHGQGNLRHVWSHMFIQTVI